MATDTEASTAPEADSSNVKVTDAFAYIDSEAKNYGIDPRTARNILLAENFNESAIPDVLKNPDKYSLKANRTSPKGARGVMQVMPATLDNLKAQGHAWSDTDHSSWESQIDMGLAALREIRQRTGSTDMNVTAADYNAGPQGSKALRSGGTLPAETTNYLKKVGLADAANNSTALPSASQRDARLGEPSPTSPSQRDVRIADTVDRPSQIASTMAANQVEDGAFDVPPSASTGTGGEPTKLTTTTIQGFDAIDKIVKDNGIVVKNLIAQITGDSTKEQQAQLDSAAEIQRAGKAAGLAAEAKGAIDAAGSQSRDRILKVLNLNSSNADNAIAGNIAEFYAVENERTALAKTVDAKMAINPFEHPLDWLGAQTTLPTEVSRHNALARRQNDLSARNDMLIKTANDWERADLAASADQYTTYYANLANAAVAEANAKAGQARAAASGVAARLATTVVNLAHGDVSQQIEVAKIQRIILSDKSDAAKSAQERKDDLDFEQKAKRIGALIGAPDISLAALKRMTKADQDMWATRVAKNSIGDDLYEALAFVNKHGNLKTMRDTGNAELSGVLAGMQQLVVQKAQGEASVILAKGGKLPPRDEMLRSAANSLELEFFGGRTNMLTTPAYSPYKIDHGATVMGWKGDENNPVYKLVKDQYSKQVKMTDQQVVSTITAFVENGRLAPTQAAQAMSEYFTNAIQRNNKTRAYKLMGMDMQSDYQVLPKESRVRIDITNAGQMDNFFVKRAATMRALEQGGGFAVGVDEDNQVGFGSPQPDQTRLPKPMAGATQ